LQDGPALPRSVVERLACAGRVRTVVHDCDGTPLDVGRSHRLVTAKLFRALLERDRGCTHPGCGSRRFLHAHHVRSWMHGGNTDLNNLLLLCGAHHRALHDGAFSLQAAGRGRWRFLRADGHELLASVHPERYADRTGAVDAEHPTAPDAPTTRWTGDRVSRHFAVGVIAERRAASARGGAERPPRAFPDHDPWAATPA
ncbi:MAG: HNH endonuclease signature motif containing protein, partial [Jatrophihabitans sp.]|uniref:HNH endonuclease signature motif containing protein n=1 Tax=Jatrophihabitans sp. TaxID=1932789 RepID=UPI003F807144